MIGNRITALRYVLGRIAQAILVLWAAYTLTYCILNMLPSDPVALMVKAKGTDISSLSGEEISQLEHLYGLDKGPIHAYFAMLFKALHGDLGSSYTYGVPVTSLIIDRIASTLVIGLLAIVLAAVLARSDWRFLPRSPVMAWCAGYCRRYRPSACPFRRSGWDCC